jgi:hypothetical protein
VWKETHPHLGPNIFTGNVTQLEFIASGYEAQLLAFFAGKTFVIPSEHQTMRLVISS